MLEKASQNRDELWVSRVFKALLSIFAGCLNRLAALLAVIKRSLVDGVDVESFVLELLDDSEKVKYKKVKELEEKKKKERLKKLRRKNIKFRSAVRKVKKAKIGSKVKSAKGKAKTAKGAKTSGKKVKKEKLKILKVGKVAHSKTKKSGSPKGSKVIKANLKSKEKKVLKKAENTLLIKGANKKAALHHRKVGKEIFKELQKNHKSHGGSSAKGMAAGG